MRRRCDACGLLATQCVCATITPIANGTPVRILQHPRETHHALNTARWVALGLRDAQITAAAHFTDCDWTVKGRQSMLLFPVLDGAGSDCTAPAASVLPACTLVVLDGTWKQAAAILRAHPALMALPRLNLDPASRSAYRLRKSPRTDGLSTVEAVAAALDRLDAPQRHDALLRPFHAQIDAQVARQVAIMGEVAFRRNYPHAAVDTNVSAGEDA